MNPGKIVDEEVVGGWTVLPELARWILVKADDQHLQFVQVQSFQDKSFFIDKIPESRSDDNKVKSYEVIDFPTFRKKSASFF